MGDLSTAMRDPTFYTWHTHINDIFMKFKDSLPSYSIPQVFQIRFDLSLYSFAIFISLSKY